MWFILMNVPYKLEKNVYDAVVGEGVYSCQLYPADCFAEFNYELIDFLPARYVHF